MPAAIEAAKSAKMDGIWITAVGFDPGAAGLMRRSYNQSHPRTTITTRPLLQIPWIEFCKYRRLLFALGVIIARLSTQGLIRQTAARVRSNWRRVSWMRALPCIPWQLVSGPGTATFLPQANVINPTVSFSAAGDYVLRLTATDSSMQSEYDDVTIPQWKWDRTRCYSGPFTIPAPTSDKTSHPTFSIS